MPSFSPTKIVYSCEETRSPELLFVLKLALIRPHQAAHTPPPERRPLGLCSQVPRKNAADSTAGCSPPVRWWRVAHSNHSDAESDTDFAANIEATLESFHFLLIRGVRSAV